MSEIWAPEGSLEPTTKRVRVALPWRYVTSTKRYIAKIETQNLISPHPSSYAQWTDDSTFDFVVGSWQSGGTAVERTTVCRYTVAAGTLAPHVLSIGGGYWSPVSSSWVYPTEVVTETIEVTKTRVQVDYAALRNYLRIWYG